MTSASTRPRSSGWTSSTPGSVPTARLTATNRRSSDDQVHPVRQADEPGRADARPGVRNVRPREPQEGDGLMYDDETLIDLIVEGQKQLEAAQHETHLDMVIWSRGAT